MRTNRWGGLVIVAALAACTGDTPTGVDAPETFAGAPVNHVADLGMYKQMQFLVPDDELQCEPIDFSYYAGGTISAPFAPLPTLPVFGGDVDVVIEVLSWNPSTPPSGDVGTGQALIFDTSVPSANDPDLVLAGQSVVPNLGNVLTHQSAIEAPSPGDADVESEIRLDFTDGDYYVDSYSALDQEGVTQNEFIRLRADGVQVGITSVAMDFADAVEVVDVDMGLAPFSDRLVFDFDGSGAVDDIVVCRVIERGGEGCTPGYWKQDQHFGSWPVPTNTLFSTAFPDACDSGGQNARSPESGDICDMTLLEALGLKGGGQNALARHAAAAWLNAGSTVEYKYLQSEIEAMVEAAFDTDSFESTKDALAEANEAGCPLGRAELDD